jgi:hypothetical protein
MRGVVVAATFHARVVGGHVEDGGERGDATGWLFMEKGMRIARRKK